MKEISIIRLALTFAGCFLGAGYVSGQELWQFFGQFGSRGWLGLPTAVLVLFAAGAVVLLIARERPELDMTELVICWDIPWLRALSAVLQLIFLFGITTVMSAGAGALLTQLFGWPVWLGGVLLCSAVAIVSISGISGVVRAFSFTVPTLVTATVVFAVAAVYRFGWPTAVEQNEGGNPLLANWFISALTFACYNMFASVAVLGPLGPLLRRKSIFCGVMLGSLLLLLIASGVMLSIFAYPQAGTEPLPMLALAAALYKPLGYCYGFLLLLGMFGAALSCIVALEGFIKVRFAAVRRHSALFAVLMAMLCFVCGLVGFGDLIGVVYPIFGYCSSAFLVCLFIHYFKLRHDSAPAVLEPDTEPQRHS